MNWKPYFKIYSYAVGIACTAAMLGAIIITYINNTNGRIMFFFNKYNEQGIELILLTIGVIGLCYFLFIYVREET